MHWLSGWLKDLILIILLASFVDLMLPSHSMQRYVKTVFSLFLLMTLLSPVFSLFQKGWNADRLVAAATAQMDDPQTVAVDGKASGQMPSLQAIMQKSGDLQAVSNKEAQQLLEAQLAEAMQAAIELQTGRKVEDIKVSTGIDDKGTPHITVVRVILSHTDEASASKNGPQLPADRTIGAVKPVIIDIEQIVDRDTADGDSGGRPSQSRLSSRTMPDQASGDGVNGGSTRVRQFIMQQWQLKEEQVTVTIG